jgi:hypothetical protein
VETNTTANPEYLRKRQFLDANPQFTEGWLNDTIHGAADNGLEAAGGVVRLVRDGARRGIVLIKPKAFFAWLEGKSRRVAA